ncbi:hypothetical protein [Alicyclobacillus sp. ALC3]|uniref:hypothetical protein n=1 Tax=Alicyclobacillus sp. ALC3 TaxID=2796143 RepID=UPI0023789DBA|nr:hypothetical protein [Alicyclobacillus sp. ALC3]WDL99035.1 hypothetical protein JC200_10500 [Alicyclobacillus sp. ALC3]
MIIGFGFGNPLVSLLMLLVTGTLSYLIYRATARRRGGTPPRPTRAQMRQYYYEQRRRAQQFSNEYNLTDEEIERRIDEKLGPPSDKQP